MNEEILAVLKDIRDALNDMNAKMDLMRTDIVAELKEEIQADVADAVEKLAGDPPFNAVSDVCEKLDDVCDGLSDLRTDLNFAADEAANTVVKQVMGNGLFNNLSDIYSKLNDLDSTLAALGDVY